MPSGSKSTAATYDDITVGDSASFSVTITEAMIDDFTRFSGDMNPLHVDEAYAQSTMFHGRVAHGMIAGSLFSRLVGMHLPGTYALYLSQTLQFFKPIMIGDEVVIRGEVTGKVDSAKTVTVKTTAQNKDGSVTFVRGEALVRLLQ